MKVAKKLPGTIHDPLWQFPFLPCSLPVPSDGSDSVAVDSLGFGGPNPTRPHSRALQRQVSLLTGDRRADYFLFDDTQRPIRVEIRDSIVKMMSRIFRGFALGEELLCVEFMAEYLIKIMEHTPGLSRRSILAQFSEEYEVDVEAKVAEIQRRGLSRPGTSYLETASKNVPGLTSMHLNPRSGW